jgi:inward rectifier potassium channel
MFDNIANSDLYFFPHDAEVQEFFTDVQTFYGRSRIAAETLIQATGSMPRRRRNRRGISVRFGSTEFLKINAARYDWRDLYHNLLTFTWPQFAGLILAIYLLVNLFFGLLYFLAPGSIAEMRPYSFADAFFFSVETLATVGYGHMYPQSSYGHWVATLEIMLGMFGMAVITGLIFIRFARPTARIVFSKTAVFSRFDGKPTLMIRVANLRHHPMMEVKFRMLATRAILTKEGEEIVIFPQLKLVFDRMAVFPAAVTLRHQIDEASPLYGLRPDEYAEHFVRVQASVACVDSVISASVYLQQSYDSSQIELNRRFVEIYSEMSDGAFAVDYSKIHDTEPVPREFELGEDGLVPTTDNLVPSRASSHAASTRSTRS